ncbi:nitroreductase family protein [Luteimonas granuli]|uniref:Nitroreductase family protein n=1 Tax=Luteimonas granuli TaxID=1176533 RepID=A0A518N2X0_9GAMM|nr:nitroreductase family protein [Luteimonas granuli]QDW66281.1 nitroreductase family protein [Luteimonas granuli]
MSNPVIQSLRKRRSQYSLGRQVRQSQAEIEALIKEAIRLSPSSFNSQSSRAVILFGAQSEKFWGLTREALLPLVPADGFAATESKLASFAAGVGTVLFYEDQSVVKGLQENFALYADNFPVWSEQSSGIAQVATWTALAEAGIGASLQHYNPVVDEAVRREWDIPESWKLRAQMPFGSNEAPFAEKTFMDDADRFRVVA